VKQETRENQLQIKGKKRWQALPSKKRFILGKIRNPSVKVARIFILLPPLSNAS
jgi:hypothetical protein